MSKVIFSEKAWEEYLYWQTQDKKTLKRINALIKDIQRNGALTGLGKPERLKGDRNKEYSRRINDVDRLVYEFENDYITVTQCKGHYED